MEAVAWDLVQFIGMARRVARHESVSLASAPQQPYISAANGVHFQPNSEHFGSLESCLRHSATKAAITPASEKIEGFRDEVTSNAAANQLHLMLPHR